MTNKLKLIPWALGAGCIGFTLFGAKYVFQPAAPQDRPTAPVARSAVPAGLGPVVNGVVASEEEVGAYVAPEVLPLAKVKKVLVKADDHVAVGQPLIEFDDTPARKKVAVAVAAVNTAKTKLAQAEQRKTLLPQRKELEQIAIRKAEIDKETAQQAYEATVDRMERVLKVPNPNTGAPFTTEEKDYQRKNSIELRQATAAVQSAGLALEKVQKEAEITKLMNPDLEINEANAVVAGLQANVDEAQAFVDACVLKSGVAGIVDRVTVSPGQVVSPQSPQPSVIVIPSGPRLVRAEVVPEFAHKLAGTVGRKVVIYDNDNFNLTYEGTVERISEAFLTRRFGSQDMMALNANRVLECTIRVTDAAPSGKPPLHVGQPVRVSFP